jgi:single-strand DNA-binding protein
MHGRQLPRARPTSGGGPGRPSRPDYRTRARTRTEWHRVYAWRNLSKFAKTLQKGQLVTLEGTLRYREVEDEIEGITFKHRIAEVHATSMKRLSKIETADDPADGAGDE